MIERFTTQLLRVITLYSSDEQHVFRFAIQDDDIAAAHARTQAADRAQEELKEQLATLSKEVSRLQSTCRFV